MKEYKLKFAKEFIYGIDEIEVPVDYIISLLDGEKNSFPVLLLSGEMGSGKTTLIRQIVNKYIPDANVNSPTFNLLQEYLSIEYEFFHFDLYRINKESELDFLGFEEIWGLQGISFVEWWEIADMYFGAEAIVLKLEIVDEKRRIEIGRKKDIIL